MPQHSPTLDLSVIAPAHNEVDNVAALLEELDPVLRAAGLNYELLVIDDGSTDSTRDRLLQLSPSYPSLAVVAMLDTPPGRGNGQSAAFKAGIGLAQAPYIALFDTDLQNDPQDLPRLLELLRSSGADMIQGDRSADRQDSIIKKLASRVGRLFRRMVLGDTIRDTGCSLRVFKTEVGQALSLQYAGMHRFIPFAARMLGFSVTEIPVSHRPRVAGSSKYGVWNRALPGLVDLLAVRWMGSRLRSTRCEVIVPARGREES